MNSQAFLLYTSSLFTPLVAHPTRSRKQFNILKSISILNSTSSPRIFTMATKSSLLSCLLVGLGIAQHPISDGTQTQDIPTLTSPAGFATSIDPPLPPDSWECEISPENITKYNELVTRFQKMPMQSVINCLSTPTIPDTPQCEALQELVDFLESKCPNMPSDYVLANTFGNVNTDSSGSRTAEHAGYAMLDDTDPQTRTQCLATLSPEEAARFVELEAPMNDTHISFIQHCLCDLTIPDWPELINPDRASCEAVEAFKDFYEPRCPGLYEIGAPVCTGWQETYQECTSCPENMECQALWRRLKSVGMQFWDKNGVNDESCTSSPPIGGESLLRQCETTAVGSRPAHGDSLEQQDADEPYHPALKPIYDDCDVLEDPEEHAICVLAGLERALCEREPWIRECRDWQQGSAEQSSSKYATLDNELLDEIFYTGGVVPVADDDFHHRPLATAASEPTVTDRLIEWLPRLDLEPFFEECEHADGYISVEDCVYEKLRDDVCSNNPGDEVCQVPRATLINGGDLPVEPKTAGISN